MCGRACAGSEQLPTWRPLDLIRKRAVPIVLLESHPVQIHPPVKAKYASIPFRCHLGAVVFTAWRGVGRTCSEAHTIVAHPLPIKMWQTISARTDALDAGSCSNLWTVSSSTVETMSGLPLFAASAIDCVPNVQCVAEC